MARGAFRRRIMAWTEPGRAFAAIEDDLHHFRIDLRHDGEKVVAIGGTPVRVPWTSCPGAVDMLSSFVGEALAPSPGLRKSGVVASHQCTHMFDIVKIAMAQALRGGRRQYDIEVLDRIDTETRATIRRDGELVFSWDVRGNLVTGPATFAGHDITGRAIWPEGSVPDADALETALVLRRGLLVAYYRILRPTALVASDMPPRFQGLCHSFQPGIAPTGLKVAGHEQYFDERPNDLLIDLAPVPVPA